MYFCSIRFVLISNPRLSQFPYSNFTNNSMSNLKHCLCRLMCTIFLPYNLSERNVWVFDQKP